MVETDKHYYTPIDFKITDEFIYVLPLYYNRETEWEEQKTYLKTYLLH